MKITIDGERGRAREGGTVAAGEREKVEEGASIDYVRKILLLYPCKQAADLHYEIHATTLTSSAFS